MDVLDSECIEEVHLQLGDLPPNTTEFVREVEEIAGSMEFAPELLEFRNICNNTRCVFIHAGV